MRIYSVQSTEFTGKLKQGDLLKKLNHLNEVAKIKGKNLTVGTNASSDASLYKFLDNPEEPTFKDDLKIFGSATSTVTGSTTSRALSITDASGTWSIYSLLS